LEGGISEIVHDFFECAKWFIQLVTAHRVKICSGAIFFVEINRFAFDLGKC